MVLDSFVVKAAATFFALAVRLFDTHNQPRGDPVVTVIGEHRAEDTSTMVLSPTPLRDDPSNLVAAAPISTAAPPRHPSSPRSLDLLHPAPPQSESHLPASTSEPPRSVLHEDLSPFLARVRQTCVDVLNGDYPVNIVARIVHSCDCAGCVPGDNRLAYDMIGDGATMAMIQLLSPVGKRL